MISKTDIFL